mgnify:FL=1
MDAVLERAVREELAAEPSMIAESLGVFAGRRRGWHVAAAVVTFVSFAVVVLAAVRFFGASGLEEKLMWATVFLGGLIVTLALKVYFWLQMVRNAVLREVKRVELRVVEGNRA